MAKRGSVNATNSKKRRFPRVPGAASPHLSPQQERLLRHVNSGASWLQIAQRLKISVAAVSCLWYNTKQALGIRVRNRYAVIAQLRASGILTAPKRGGMKPVTISPYARQILRGVLAGHGVTQIAEGTGRNEIAVRQMLRNLRRKLNAPTDLHAAERAIELGLLRSRRVTTKNLLTVRELEILTRAAQGHSAAAIARELAISRSNVKNRYAGVKAKLRVTSIDEAIVEADRRELFDQRRIDPAVIRRLKAQRHNVPLTRREQDIYDAMRRGTPSTEALAQTFGISQSTVARLRVMIRAKRSHEFLPTPPRPRPPQQKRRHKDDAVRPKIQQGS